MKPDLELVASAELLDELLSRYDAGIFVGQPKITKDINWQVRVAGDRKICLGLLAIAQGLLVKCEIKGVPIDGL